MSIKLNAQSGGSVALDAPTQTTSSADNVYKLPVADGSAGQVLKTDGSGNLSWTTITDTNSLVKLASTTITSSTASVIFNTSTSGFLDGTYKTHLVKFTGVQIDTDSKYLVMSVYESGTEKTDNEYQGERERNGNNYYNGNDRFVFNTNTIGNNTSGNLVYEDFSGHVYFQNYEVNRRFSVYGQMVYMNTSSTVEGSNFCGVYNGTNAQDGVKFFLSGGTFLKGKWTLYGVVD
tara:strand:+ start:757 stop:1455 length:699 start_codon:yes stop_codon:yes gene_type:complete